MPGVIDLYQIYMMYIQIVAMLDYAAIYTAVVITILTVGIPFIIARGLKAWKKHLNRIDNLEWYVSAINKGCEEQFEFLTLDKGNIYTSEREKHFAKLKEKDKLLNKDR